jgi:hypothetical protein
MPNLVPWLNPQPEPPSPALAIAIMTGTGGEETGTFQIVTHAGVIEINFKTGHVTMKIPEKFPHWSAINALGAAINTWYAAKDVKGLEELRTQAEQLMVSSAKVVGAALQARVSA